MLRFRSFRRLSLGLSFLLVPVVAFNSGCPVNTDDGGDDGGDDGTKTDTTYSGQATVFRATIGGRETVLVDTGALPAAGGLLDATGLTVEVPNVLLAEVGHAATFAGNGVAQAEAALANVDLRIGNHKVQADFLMSRAIATCSAPENGTASVKGELIAANLRIDDQVTTVTTAPNQEIELSDGVGNVVGRVVLNEQVASADGAAGDITVSGLRFEVTNVASVVLFSSHADVSCATNTPGDDFVTGGGLFDGQFNHIYFAIAGGVINGQFKGHLAYKDTGTSMRAIGTGVTGYSVVDATTRRIEGTCQIDGVDGFTYTAEVTDNGEPGNSDTFSIEFSNGITATAGGLIGGNLQLHAKGSQ